MFWLIVLALAGLAAVFGWRIVRPSPRAVRSTARQMNERARRHLEQGDLEKAEETIKVAFRLLGARMNSIDRALLLNQLALVASAQGRPEDAIQHFREVLALLETAGRPENVGQVLNSLAALHIEAGRPQEAAEALDRALTIARAGTHRALERQSLANLAGLYLHQDQDDQAFKLLTTATAIRVGQGEDDHEGLVRGNLAVYWMRRGEFGHAREQLALAGQASHSSSESRIKHLHNLAVLHRTMGEREKSLKWFQQALGLARQGGDRRLEGMVLNGMAGVHQAAGTWSDALGLLEQALTLRRESKDAAGEGTTLDGIANALAHLGRPDEALSAYEKALQLRRGAGDARGEAETLHNLGTFCAQRLHDSDRGRQLLQQSLALRRQQSDRAGIAVTLENLGVLEDKAGDAVAALALLTQSMAIHDELRSAARIDELQASLDRNTGRVYRIAVGILLRLGRVAEAFEMTERARARVFVNRIGSMRPAPRSGVTGALLEKERQLRADLTRLDRERAQAASRRANQKAMDSIADRLAHAREAYEELLVEMKLANPDYGSLLSPSAVPLAVLQQDLGADITLLSYFDTLDDTVAFVVTQQAVQAFQLHLALDGLGITLTRFRDPSADTSRELDDLYRSLVEPVRAALQTRLVAIAATGLLHFVPFSSLGGDGRRFGDEHALFHVPSAGAFHLISQKRRSGGVSLLAMACAAPAGLAPLGFVDEEARAVAACYARSRVATGTAATEGFFRSEAPNFAVLHLAAHAGVDPAYPLFSRVVLHPDAEHDGLLHVHEIYDLPLDHAQLVVLSACDTQVGPASGSDEIVGLSRAFFFAGARTVLASLWKVDDEATKALMVEFHRQISGGVAAVEALQNAQASVRKIEGHRHPYYWAPFVLWGDPGRLTAA